MSTLYLNATLFPVHDATASPGRGHFLVDDGVFAVVGHGAAPADLAAGHDVVDLRGRFVLPGFVSAHSHLWQSAFRGIADGCGTFAWISQLHKRFGPLFGVGDMHAFAAFGHHELLRNGITTVCDHTHDFGAGPAEQWQAALDSPQRTVYSFSSPRDASASQRLTDIDKFLAHIADTRAQMLGISVNTTGVLDLDDMRTEASYLRELGLGGHAHYLEDPSVAAAQQADWDALVASGRVDSQTVFAHFIHTTPHIRRSAATAGASMVWNPLSNGRLGSGIPDIVGYLDDGIAVGLGVDGQASADVADPFQNMRTGLYLLRAQAQSATAMTAAQILRMHTLDSAAVLGVDDAVGSIEVGKHADFVVVDPAHPVGADVDDLWATAVLSLSAADITAVHVGGELVSTGPHDRNHALEREAQARVSRLYSEI